MATIFEIVTASLLLKIMAGLIFIIFVDRILLVARLRKFHPEIWREIGSPPVIGPVDYQKFFNAIKIGGAIYHLNDYSLVAFGLINWICTGLALLAFSCLFFAPR